MWMTGFDVPSCSTIYLDRPMRNHTLMQTIARANRVFPDKENGLIVDYVGVFRNLEAALAIYAAARRRRDDADIIRDKSALVGELEDALGELVEFSERWDVDLDGLREREGFEFIALRDASVEALLVDDVPPRLSRALRPVPPAVRRDPARPGRHRALAGCRRHPEPRRKIRSLERAARRTDVAGAVSELLDRSVGAEEYVIRAAAERRDAEPLIDLNTIDFDALAARLAGRKRSCDSTHRRPLGRSSRRGAAQPRAGSIWLSGSST